MTPRTPGTHALAVHTAPAPLVSQPHPASPAADVETASWTHPWLRLLPLWRHGVWLAALFAVLAISVAVRLDVRQTQRDLHRNASMTREATLLNERLHLEVQTRQAARVMETQAAALGLVGTVEQVRLSGGDR